VPCACPTELFHAFTVALPREAVERRGVEFGYENKETDEIEDGEGDGR
jgi:hypothetical protein